MERVTHGDAADEDDLYSAPPPRDTTGHASPTLRPAEQPLHDRATPPSPPLSTAARSSASYTATTARSFASTTLSTLATSSHASNMSNADAKDAAALRARQAQHARPQTTLLNLVSDTATSSALPQPFGFSISRKGRMVAVYSTKNIWLLQADKLPRTFIRTLELRRKPIAIDILDDGSRLAVLSNPHKVDLYRLQDGENTTLERMKSVILTVDANTIALSPDGMVLATGYQFGIELISLAEKASEHDRRSVNCDPMDHLAFSDDGRTLLATTSAKLPRSTTLFTVHGAFDGPFTEDGELIPQECHVAWTRQILFPEKAVTAKQALLLPDTITGQVNELFAFDAEEDSWGIYDLAGVQFVETKEPPPEVGRFMRAESLEDALPAVSPSAEHVAVAVKQQDANSIWLYRLPDAYESNAAVYRDLRQHSDHHTPVAPCAYISLQRPEDTSSQDISAMRWLSPPSHEPSSTERLLAVGNVVWNTTPDTPIMPGETAKTTGILIMMDFDFSQGPDACGRPDNTKRIEIDLDEALPGEKLPEDDIDFEREVELVRTRTVAQKRGEAARAAARNNLLRSSSTTSPAPVGSTIDITHAHKSDTAVNLAAANSTEFHLSPYLGIGTSLISTRAAISVCTCRTTPLLQPQLKPRLSAVVTASRHPVLLVLAGEQLGTPNLIEINAREREKDRSDFDRVKEGMRKLRCIVM
ncbi:F-box domain-containing protein [Lasiodiplodia theobromae]|uniref:F-box domain-containing protein n=1 Tax=Lasiodiplodia theobromae TaxID=45133 RepID=UPI0015C36ABE|nr:F-box domain-containing protein [Lasiodiplodia theobromae]KAF4542114.1 F-box domain-containing protein [Lasiodiplodia theobromae]